MVYIVTQLCLLVGYQVSLQLDQHNYMFRLLIFAIVRLYTELIELLYHICVVLFGGYGVGVCMGRDLACIGGGCIVWGYYGTSVVIGSHALLYGLCLCVIPLHIFKMLTYGT
jgi:hypothetical protein